VADLVAGVRGGSNVLAEGRMNDGMWWVGQSQGPVNHIRSVRDVIDAVITEAEIIMSDVLPAQSS